MPSAVSPNPRAGPNAPDDPDSLPNYDREVDDFLKDLPLNGDDDDDKAGNPASEQKNIDEEITVKRKRKPVPKLDENLLLSGAGIPKLRRIAKTRLRFRGKGHEFGDMSRLLNMYQLWMDDMYPRAKFRDAVTLVEKAGHSKRMQVMRRAWLDETKPGRREEEMERIEEVVADAEGNVEMQHGVDQGQEWRDGDAGRDGVGIGGEQNDVPEEDELDALLGESIETAKSGSNITRRGPFEEQDGPDDDELDELMAQDNPGAGGNTKTPGRAGPFDETESDGDDLDALLDDKGPASATVQDQSHPHTDRGEFADEEEVLAEMGGMW